MTDATETHAEADTNWTCWQCESRIADIQPETWLAVPCGHYVTHVQMVMMAYGSPSWPVIASPSFSPQPAPRYRTKPTLVRRILMALGWFLGAVLAAGLLVMCGYGLHQETLDRDFANWCQAQGGRVTFGTDPSGWTDTGTGRCFEYGTSRLILTEDAWKATRP